MFELFQFQRPGRPTRNSSSRFIWAFQGAFASSLVVWPLLAWVIFSAHSDQLFEYAGATVDFHKLLVIGLVFVMVLYLLPVTLIAGVTAFVVSWSFPDELTRFDLMKLGLQVPCLVLVLATCGKLIASLVASNSWRIRGGA